VIISERSIPYRLITKQESKIPSPVMVKERDVVCGLWSELKMEINTIELSYAQPFMPNSFCKLPMRGKDSHG
jgi:hypothetical protein